MKLYCPISGVSYQTTLGTGHGQAPHPIFYLTLDQVLEQNLEAGITGKLGDTELHLVCCAIFHKLPVVWEVALAETPNTLYIWKRNFEKLASTAIRYKSRKHKEVPQYHIDRFSASLGNLPAYLEEANFAMTSEYLADSPKASYEIQQDEVRILSIIRQSLNKAEKRRELPKLMAQWAADVGNFPTGFFPNSKGQTVSISDHWKSIIEAAFKTTDYTDIITSDITFADISELLEHCEQHIDYLSMHSETLLSKLRDMHSVLQEFKNPRVTKANVTEVGDITASLLGEVETISASVRNKPQPVTPSSEPVRSNYSSAAKYLAAKLQWQKSRKN